MTRAFDQNLITKALNIECLGETKPIVSGIKCSIISCHSPLAKTIRFCELYSFSGKNGCHTFFPTQTNDLVTCKSYVKSFYWHLGFKKMLIEKRALRLVAKLPIDYFCSSNYLCFICSAYLSVAALFKNRNISK